MRDARNVANKGQKSATRENPKHATSRDSQSLLQHHNQCNAKRLRPEYGPPPVKGHLLKRPLEPANKLHPESCLPPVKGLLLKRPLEPANRLRPESLTPSPRGGPPPVTARRDQQRISSSVSPYHKWCDAVRFQWPI